MPVPFDTWLKPGPDHVAAAHWLFGYIRGDMDGGLTFHGQDSVLNQCSLHRHLPIGSCDAGFDHEGRKAVSGAAISMNGAAIAVVARCQSTASQQTAEAEVKATFLLAEMLQGVVGLRSEITGVRHPWVRSMIDSKSGFSQVSNVTGTQASAPYTRAQAYTEEKVYNGLMSVDLIPGIRFTTHQTWLRSSPSQFLILNGKTVF